MHCRKFLLNTLLIADAWEPSNLHLYADDQQLYKSCWVSELNESLNQMRSELTHINDWLIANKFKPNVGKYKFQIIGTKKQLSKINDIEQIKLDIGGERVYHAGGYCSLSGYDARPASFMETTRREALKRKYW